MPIQTILNARVPVKVWTDRIEPEAMAQLKNTAALPFVFRHVAAMADVHLGKGATVGQRRRDEGRDLPGRRRRGHRLRDGGPEDVVSGRPARRRRLEEAALLDRAGDPGRPREPERSRSRAPRHG